MGGVLLEVVEGVNGCGWRIGTGILGGRGAAGAICKDQDGNIQSAGFTRKKKGQKPTRILVHTAKATGFSSVSDGKIFKKPRPPYEECLDAELKLVGEYGLRCSMASSSDEVPVWERRAFCNILPVWDRSSVRVNDTYAS
ncbi:hypothetical protein IFM89_007095 [Coptis chinensis]|uniref:Uncharacterized protein n=1 Tax=Coptis chinensis TaxID=261450 RepID=A0A835H3V5_9MAGN|nr:hypothetical protein IFM89_007095 [Coptis chinensis]